MNLNFTDLFNSQLDKQGRGQLDRSFEENEGNDYERDEADEHYLSEYGDRNETNATEPHLEDELEENDRFSHKGHFYDQTNHDRFNRSSENNG